MQWLGCCHVWTAPLYPARHWRLAGLCRETWTAGENGKAPILSVDDASTSAAMTALDAEMKAKPSAGLVLEVPETSGARSKTDVLAGTMNEIVHPGL
jgi:hypothetical protein